MATDPFSTDPFSFLDLVDDLLELRLPWRVKRAAFFFGAGISRASGKPLAADITKSALKDDWHLHTDQNFYPAKDSQIAGRDSVVRIVQQFLSVLNELAAEYLQSLARSETPREVHYEDLFSLSQQAVRSHLDYVPNLAVVEFCRRLRAETEQLHKRFTHGTQGGEGLAGLAETTCDFLHWVVHHKLNSDSGPRKGLDVITDTVASVDELDIFTLNHDLLVEGQCSENGVSVEDGFSDQRGELRAFSGWTGIRNSKVRLFKLHGSINWYLYDFPGWARQYAIASKSPFHSHDENGILVNPVDYKAAFLSGTVVKEQHYGVGFFGDLFYAFRKHLSTHTRLIASGYSFSDPGINSRMIQWLGDDLHARHQLVILHEGDSEEFFRTHPYWLRALNQRGQVKLVNLWLQDCQVAQLQEFFDD